MIKKVIPTKKILIITPNDDIFKQIKNHVEDFNNATFRYKKIYLRNIGEYEQRSALKIKAICQALLIETESILEEEQEESLITLFRKKEEYQDALPEIEEIQEMFKSFIYKKTL